MADLEALYHELIAAAARNDHGRLEEKNYAFHREITLLADSRKIIWLLGLVTRYVPRQFYSSIPGWPRATMDDHAELVQGMKAKDPEATRGAMQQHIVHSGELLAARFNARVAAETDNESTYSGESDDPGSWLWPEPWPARHWDGRVVSNLQVRCSLVGHELPGTLFVHPHGKGTVFHCHGNSVDGQVSVHSDVNQSCVADDSDIFRLVVYSMVSDSACA